MPLLPVRAGEWPFSLVTPLVGAHDKKAERRVIDGTVVDALQPVVEPVQFDGVQVEHRADAEVDVPRAGAFAESMRPRADNQLRIARGGRAAILPQSVEVVERSMAVEVVPAAHFQHRHCHLIESIREFHWLPVIVIGGMVDPVLPERYVVTDFVRQIGQRQCAKQLGPVMKVDALRGTCSRPHAPRDGDVQLHRAAGENEIRKVVVAHHTRHNALQKLALQRRAHPLHGRLVRRSRHADLPVAPRLMADPLLRVVTVTRLVHEGIVFALGIPAPARILNHAGVAPVRESTAFANHVGNVVAVRRSNQHGRKRTSVSRQVQIRRQIHPIVHRHGNVQSHVNVAVFFHFDVSLMSFHWYYRP